MQLGLHHIAVLTRSLQAVETALPSDLERLPIDEFADLGTREQYIDLEPTGRSCLLLFQAIGPGPYERALQKRGPGLHHFGCHTNDLQAAVAFFAEQRLLLHPFSLESRADGVIWMCRPGVPFLLEIIEREDFDAADMPSLRVGVPGMPPQFPFNIPHVTIEAAQGAALEVSCGPHALTIQT